MSCRCYISPTDGGMQPWISTQQCSCPHSTLSSVYLIYSPSSLPRVHSMIVPFDSPWAPCAALQSGLASVALFHINTSSQNYLISSGSHHLQSNQFLFFFFFLSLHYIDSCTNFKLYWSIKLYSELWVLTFLLKAELLYAPPHAFKQHQYQLNVNHIELSVVDYLSWSAYSSALIFRTVSDDPMQSQCHQGQSVSGSLVVWCMVTWSTTQLC